MTAPTARNVMFDFGGVLVRWRPDEVLARLFDDPAVHERLMQEMLKHPDWLDFDRGTLEEPDAIERFARRTGFTTGEIATLMHELRESLTPLPDSIALLEDLSKRGVPLYGLSNMPIVTFARLRERYGFWSLFRGIVISGEIKLLKPEPEIFHHAAGRFGLSYGETLFIDDHEPNIATARQLGLNTVLFRDCADCTRAVYAALGIQ